MTAKSRRIFMNRFLLAAFALFISNIAYSLTCAEQWDVLRAKNPVGLKLTYKQTNNRTVDGEAVSFESFFERKVISSTDQEISYSDQGGPSWFPSSYTKEDFLADCQESDIKESVTTVTEANTTTIVPGLTTVLALGSFPSQLKVETWKRAQGHMIISITKAQDGSGWVLKTYYETLNYSPEPDHVTTTELVKVELP